MEKVSRFLLSRLNCTDYQNNSHNLVICPFLGRVSKIAKSMYFESQKSFADHNAHLMPLEEIV
jgi:hypothetical protein